MKATLLEAVLRGGVTAKRPLLSSKHVKDKLAEARTHAFVFQMKTGVLFCYLMSPP